MRSLNDIEDSIARAKVHTDDQADRNVLNDLLERLANTKKLPADNQAKERRKIMRNPITRLAAAVFLLACVTCLLLWKSTGSGLALADVLNKIEQVATYRYQTHSTLTRPQGREERHSTVLIARDRGIKITLKTIDPNGGESQPSDTYILPQQNCMLFIMHKNKMYVRLKFDDDAELEPYRSENNDPRVIIRQLLERDHVALGKSDIDGITVEGFQTTDPNYEGSFVGMSDLMGKNQEVSVTLWVDAKTLLPVRLVEDIVKEYGTRFHEVSDDFRWNVAIDADDFTPVIPESYSSQVSDIVVPIINEETALDGLRAFADIARRYPVHLSSKATVREYRQLTRKSGSVWEDLPPQKRDRMINDVQMPIFGLGMFYEKLIEEQRDPAYYGEQIGQDDADGVLLRWKRDDGRYRVIFGDLSARTVTAEELAELEKRRE